MTDTLPPIPTPSPDHRSRRWVWHSSDASIATGQLSVLAVVEVFAAAGLYGWMAWHLDWSWFTVVGLLAAPMLLLRSEQSVDLGVGLLRQWVERGKSVLTTREKIASIAIAGGIAAALTYSLAQAWQPGHTAGQLLWRGLVLCASAALAAASLAVAVAVARTSAGIVAVAELLGRRMATQRPDPGEASLFIRLARVVARFSAVLSTTAVALPGLAIGILVRSVMIRWVATLRHWRTGLDQLPGNWRETLWVIDLVHPPELLPNAKQVSKRLSIAGMWQERSLQKRIDNTVIAMVWTLIWYPPALMYRWSLKASAWLWWPLALALSRPFDGVDNHTRRERSAHTASGTWAYPWLVPVVVICWLALHAWPGIGQWLALLPKWSKPAENLMRLLAPPSPGLRYGLLWLVALLAMALRWRSTNLYAAWNKVLGTSDEFHKLDESGRDRFKRSTDALERLRLWLIVAIVLLCEACGLAFAYNKDPQGVARVVWPWLLHWL